MQNRQDNETDVINAEHEGNEEHHDGNEAHHDGIEHLIHETAQDIATGVNALHLAKVHVPHLVERVAMGAELAANIASSKESNPVKRAVCSTLKTLVQESASAPVISACATIINPMSFFQRIVVGTGLSIVGTPVLNAAVRPYGELVEDGCNRMLTITEHRAENGEPEEILELPRYDIVGNYSVIRLTRDPLLKQVNTELQPTSHMLNLNENHSAIVTNPLTNLDKTITDFNLSTTRMISNLTAAPESPLQNVNVSSELALLTSKLCQQNSNNQTKTIVVNADPNCALKQIAQESREITDTLRKTSCQVELNLSATLDKQNYQHWGSSAPTYYSGPATLFAVNELWGLSNSISEPPSLLDKKEEFSNKNGLSRGKKFDLETNYKYGAGGFSLPTK